MPILASLIIGKVPRKQINKTPTIWSSNFLHHQLITGNSFRGTIYTPNKGKRRGKELFFSSYFHELMLAICLAEHLELHSAFLVDWILSAGAIRTGFLGNPPLPYCEEPFLDRSILS